MQELNIEFTASGDKLEQFLDCTDRRHFLMGPLGSAKTLTCAFKALKLCVEQKPDAQGVRRSRGLVTRTTMPELKISALKDWLGLMDQFKGALGNFTFSTPATQELKFTLPDKTRVEAEILFMGLDDPDGVDKIRGMPLTWAWVNEFREIPFSIISMIFGRCGRYPRMEEGGPSWYGMFGDTNMPDTDHWIYKLAEEEKPEGWTFFKQPGGLIRKGLNEWEPNPNAENLENLPPNYYMEQVTGNKAEWIAVYLASEYGFVIDGKAVYPEFRDSFHVKPVSLSPRLPIDIGIDFGLTPAATFAQLSPMGQWRFHSELVTEDMGAVRFAELLNRTFYERYPNYTIGEVTGDPAGDIRAQTDEQTPFLILRAAKIQAKPASTNDPIIRREAVANTLNRVIDGEPGMIVDPKCVMLRKGLAGGYHYRRLRVTGTERFQDVPSKDIYSHVCESQQYCVLGRGEGQRVIRPQRRTTKIKVHTEYNVI